MKRLFILGLFLVLLPIVAFGWEEYNHCKMTANALELIKNNDKDGKYSEIYGWVPFPYYNPERDKLPENKIHKTNGERQVGSVRPPKADHPCIQGTAAEDAAEFDTKYPSIEYTLNPNEMTVQTYRDFRHYGGKGLGLEWQDYFPFSDSKIPMPSKGNRYMDARDWGYTGEQNDKMNFRGAIEAYNYYTYKARKEAYYRMGHVLHLLQDVAEPDHADLKDHPGSCYDASEIYSKFQVCEAKHAQELEVGTKACMDRYQSADIASRLLFGACVAEATGAAEINYDDCKGSNRINKIGFELLANHYWDFDRPGINQKLAILKERSYNDYFEKMADESIVAAKSKGLTTPLGLGSLLITPTESLIATGKVSESYTTIPGLDPDIEYPGQAGPYLDLIDAVIPQAANRCAGILMDFYEIVNYPPYIKSVKVIQGSDNLSEEDILAKLPNIIYGAEWKDNSIQDTLGERIVSRNLVRSIDEPIDISKRVYVVVEVNDNLKDINMELENIKKYQMKKIKNENKYFASFSIAELPANAISQDCEEFRMIFNGEDMEAHFSNRNYSGSNLDGNPETLACTGENPPYDWRGYEPEGDKNHRIKVILADEFDKKILNNDSAQATELKYSNQTQSIIGDSYYLTLHESNDIDFFYIQLPARTQKETDCRKYSLTDEGKKDRLVRPGILRIYANSVDAYNQLCLTTDPLAITFYDKKNIAYPQIPLVKSPGTTLVALDEDEIDKYFPDGKITFSIKSESGQILCYNIGVSHHWCETEKLKPDLTMIPPELKYIRFPYPLELDPETRLLYPENLENIKHVVEGEDPASEYMVFEWPKKARLQIDIRYSTPEAKGDLNFILLDSSGKTVTKATEINRQPEQSGDLLTIRMASALQDSYMQTTIPCDVCGIESSRRDVYSRWKQIAVNSLDPGTYLLEVTGKSYPAFYSIQFVGTLPVANRTLTITSTKAAPGTSGKVQVNISDAGGIAGGDIMIKYDPDIINIGEIKGTDAISELNLIANKDMPGKILIGMAGLNPIKPGSAVLIDMVFSVKENAKIGTETMLELGSDTEVYNESGVVIPVKLENSVVEIIELCLKGDVNQNGKVLSNDAILALRIAIGLIEPTDYQKCAADMNKDGKIKSNDAILILREAAGMTAPGMDVIKDASRETTLNLGEVYGTSGENITVPFKVDNIVDLSGGDICISYDSEILRAVDVLSDSSMYVVSNIAQPGIIRIAFASAERLTSKEIFRLRFNVIGDNVSPLRFKTAEFYRSNTLPIDMRLIDGKFISWAVPAEYNMLLQNFPNPSNPETWIPYNLKDDATVVIKIYTAAGQLIRTLDIGYRSSGFYTPRERAAYWDGMNESGEKVASGVYFYTIAAGDFIATKKLIIQR